MLLIIVGLTAGWMTGKVMNAGGSAPLMDIVIGIIRACCGLGQNSPRGFVGSLRKGKGIERPPETKRCLAKAGSIRG